MENDALREIVLSDDQIADGCTRHSLHLSSVDDVVLQIVNDEYPPVRVSRNEPVSAQQLYDLLHFSRGSKYELLGLESHGDMNEFVYRDFFSLMFDIVSGLNALDPGSIVEEANGVGGVSE